MVQRRACRRSPSAAASFRLAITAYPEQTGRRRGHASPPWSCSKSLPAASRSWPLSRRCDGHALQERKRQGVRDLSRGALRPATDGRVIPASEWLDFYLLSPRTWRLTRECATDCAGMIAAGSRWARLAGIGSRRSRRFPVGAFGWYRALSGGVWATLPVAWRNGVGLC